MSIKPIVVDHPDNHTEGEYLTAAQEAAEARKRFSEQFLLYKAKGGVTDGQATHQAYIDCGIDRDMAEARLELARLRLTR